MWPTDVWPNDVWPEPWPPILGVVGTDVWVIWIHGD